MKKLLFFFLLFGFIAITVPFYVIYSSNTTPLIRAKIYIQPSQFIYQRNNKGGVKKILVRNIISSKF